MNVHVITLGFAPARIIREGFRKKWATSNPDLAHTHWLLDQHYPLDRERHAAELPWICEQYGVNLVDGEYDRGLHHGFNHMLSIINPKPGDVIISYDPDSGPLIQGWDMALVTAITLGKFEIASTVDPRCAKELDQYGFDEWIVDGYLRVREPTKDIVIGISAWSADFLKQVGGFSEPTEYYGGLEAAMWAKMKAAKGRMCYLPDYTEENLMRAHADPEYHAYKYHHSHLRLFKGSFAEYLKWEGPKPPVPETYS